jgi:glutamate-1-semialdehyde 2,1-aminomutase
MSNNLENSNKAFIESLNVPGKSCNECKSFSDLEILNSCCYRGGHAHSENFYEDSDLGNLGIKHKMMKSEVMWKKATEVIPGGTQTLGKSPIGFIDGVAPKFISHGKGSRAWDVDGNEYIDCWLGALPITFGHKNAAIDDAIIEQLKNGISFSLMTELESQVASMMIEDIPIAEQVRFAKNGSDVCEAAIRLARHISGKKYVITYGYHGFHDWYVGSTDRNFGIPIEVQELTLRTNYNSIDHLKNLFDSVDNDVACIIMEPTIFEFPTKDYLNSVKELAHSKGALLVFDEMLTGYRFSRGGAMSFFGVFPDLATFGKGIANGMPIAMLVGPKKHMQHFDKVFFSSTYGGETLSLAAAKAGLQFHRDNDVISHLWDIGRIVMEGCLLAIKQNHMQDRVKLIGYPVRQTFSFIDCNNEADYKLAGLFQQEMLKRGILCNSGLGFSFSHSKKEAEYIVSAFGKVCQIMANAVESNNVDSMLEGIPAQPVFKGLRNQKVTSN